MKNLVQITRNQNILNTFANWNSVLRNQNSSTKYQIEL